MNSSTDSASNIPALRMSAADLTAFLRDPLGAEKLVVAVARAATRDVVAHYSAETLVRPPPAMAAMNAADAQRELAASLAKSGPVVFGIPADIPAGPPSSVGSSAAPTTRRPIGIQLTVN